MSSAVRDSNPTPLNSSHEAESIVKVENPYLADKASVLNGSKVFNKLPLNVRECNQTLVKLLVLLNNGKDKLTESESTDFFFNVTRLFQSKDHSLRRLMYLVIKNLHVSEAESLVVTSSLTKDINSNSAFNKANAIRTLGTVIDGSMASQIDRHLKASLLDKDPFVKSSAIICGIYIFESNPEMVKRWTNELLECVNSKDSIVQYHALNLILKIKPSDRLLLLKLLETLYKGSSAYSQSLMINFIAHNIINEGIEEKEQINFLADCLASEYTSAKLEACKAFIAIVKHHYLKFKNIDSFHYTNHLDSVINTLKSFLASDDHILSLAGLKQLYSLAQTLPELVEPLNAQLELLIRHDNPSIALMSVGTLLKTGIESTVESLLTHVFAIFHDTSDDFKSEVARALQHLSITYPSKSKLSINFLARCFQTSSFNFKNVIVDSIINIADNVPESLLYGLDSLCEFIEDCEHSSINVHILQYLSNKLTETPQPSAYIRHIYNRLILEKPYIRAAVIGCLAVIALSHPNMSDELSILFSYCLNDTDEEVRGRARVYYKALKDSDMELLASLLDLKLPFDVVRLSTHLEDRIDNGLTGTAFDITLVDKPPTRASTKESIDEQPVEEFDLQEILDHFNIGSELQLLVRTETTSLTERESDYNVSLLKYVFNSHILFQFLIENTLDFELTDINVTITPISCDPLDIIGTLPISSLNGGEQKSLYILTKLKRDLSTGCDADLCLLGTYGVTLSFNIIESSDCEPYDDTYTTIPMTLRGIDYFTPWQLSKDKFEEEWKQEDLNVNISNFALNFKTIDKAIPGFIKFMGLTLCHQSAENYHTLLLAGRFLGSCKTLISATLIPTNSSTVLKMEVRSQNKSVNKLLVTCIK